MNPQKRLLPVPAAAGLLLLALVAAPLAAQQLPTPDDPIAYAESAGIPSIAAEATILDGLAYMLRGDEGASNILPYAQEPADDNERVVTGPHIMLIVPDAALLAGIPTDPATGGPYVMWRDSRLVHVMIPVEPGAVHLHGAGGR